MKYIQYYSRWSKWVFCRRRCCRWFFLIFLILFYQQRTPGNEYVILNGNRSSTEKKNQFGLSVYYITYTSYTWWCTVMGNCEVYIVYLGPRCTTILTTVLFFEAHTTLLNVEINKSIKYIIIAYMIFTYSNYVFFIMVHDFFFLITTSELCGGLKQYKSCRHAIDNCI